MTIENRDADGQAADLRGELVHLVGLERQRKLAISETGERMLRWFTFEHLPIDLQVVSAQYCHTAVWTVRNLRAGPERTVALRKLLEAKDAAVRQAKDES